MEYTFLYCQAHLNQILLCCLRLRFHAFLFFLSLLVCLCMCVFVTAQWPAEMRWTQVQMQNRRLKVRCNKRIYIHNAC